MFFRVMIGVGQSVAFPASARTVSNWFPDTQRGLVNSSYLVGVRLGQALVGAIGVGLIATYGWRVFFVGSGLVPMLWVVPWMMVLRGFEAPKRGARGEERGASEHLHTGGRFSFISSFGLLRHPTVVGTFLGFFAYDYVWFVYTSWLQQYLLSERQFTLAQTAFHTSAPFVAMSLVILLSGIATDRLIASGMREIRVRKSFIAIGFAFAAAIVPAGLVHDNATAMGLLWISLCGIGLAAPNTWSMTQACCTKGLVGTVSGIQNFGGNIAGIIAPWLTGVIVDRTGSFAPAFVLCGFILAGGVLAYWLLMNETVQELPA
jgi:MFS family permease